MSRLQKLFRRGVRDQSGVAAIEMAVVLPVFLVFILGLVTLCHAMMVRYTMLYGLDTAARQVMVNPAVSDATLETLARSRMSSINTNLVNIGIVNTSNGSVNSKVLSSSYVYTFPSIIGLSSVTLNTSVTVRTN